MNGKTRDARETKAGGQGPLHTGHLGLDRVLRALFPTIIAPALPERPSRAPVLSIGRHRQLPSSRQAAI